MNSMTGYGRATATLGAQTLTVQVNSVNRRGLDLTLALPDEWQPFEAAVGDAVRKVALRGKVHVAVDVEGKSGANAEWDEEAIAVILEKLERVAAARGVKFEPTGELLWQIASAQRTGSALSADEATADIVLATVNQALREFSAMRAKEGEALLVDFLGRLLKLQQAFDAIAARAPLISGGYREQLHLRLRQAGLELDLNDERVLKEVALFADRCDVTEELTRLRSHFSQLRDLFKAKGEIGRKAEFILQEIGREIHTIGSKANDLAISQQVIEFKNELERVREQIANVE
ncbi:YicC/YloC family endoribonuclease [Oleiharenicola lentus]|uniref:YicC/YloC family endoribonuclease n=1 Tax=Oleiharenicola lentus TaxID=2508720 RepID=UPI003F66C543